MTQFDPDTVVVRGGAPEFLASFGYKVAKQTLAKLAVSNSGPEHFLFCGRAYYRAGPLLAWAESHASKPRRSSCEAAA